MATMGEDDAPELPKKSPVPGQIDDSDGEDDIEDKVIKIVVVGDGASGKTSICQRFAKESFDKSYHQTLGLDFFSRRIMLPQEMQVLVQVWDIGGQSIAGEMIDKYLTGANIVFFVYDVTNSKSFENVGDWLSVVKKNLKGSENDVKLVLMGNKTDLEERRVVPVDSHRNFSNSNNMMPTYVSAKTGDTVYMIFRQAVADCLKIGLSRAEIESDIDIVQGSVIEATKVGGKDGVGDTRKVHFVEDKDTAQLSRSDQSRNTS
ncbi:hypothetical protein CRE_26006, partial [Caenorhabditis remanei]